MYYVYVLRNSEGVLYKGYTSDLEKRIQQHNANDGFSSYTTKRGPWKLVYKVACKNVEDARTRERFLKSGQGRELLQNMLGDCPPEADG